jgi:hypothetical protein
LKAGEYNGKRLGTAVRLAEKAGLQAIFASTQNPAGASLLAKKPKAPLGIWLYVLSLTTIVGSPPGASSLLQGETAHSIPT